jgi:UDP-N-acetylglucosamine--N-acetylmuramyl-(pentapeptide) pyrophosphoryl-undecaprenol N-acetylglucosamine transferase
MRVLVSGGGTGGHIYPALAVATHLANEYHAEILYLGSDDGLETEVIPAAGFPFAAIKAGKLRRYISWRTLTGLARIPVGMGQAIEIVRKFRPHVAFTSGGYVAVPAGLASRIHGVPFLMHQQDVPPNLSNRLIAPLATRISVAFADSLSYFPRAKTRQLGNPVRQELLNIRQVSPQQARGTLGFEEDERLVVVTGGSQGARHLNEVICQSLADLLPHCQVLQISGRQLYEETRMLSEQHMANVDEHFRKRYRLVPYMTAEMPAALQAADLVICRSGASTLSELALLGKPSLLVPLPPAIGNSPQEANAEMFERKQAALVIHDIALKPELLVNRILSMFASQASLQAMAEAARSFAVPDATQRIADEVIKIAKGGQHILEGVVL